MAKKLNQDPCLGIILDQAEKSGIKLSDAQARRLLAKTVNYGKTLAPKFGGDALAAMQHVAREAAIRAKATGAQLYRARQIEILRRRERLNDTLKNLKLLYGEAIRASLEGSTSSFPGAKDSVNSRANAAKRVWTARLAAAGVDLRDIDTHADDIVRENWELTTANGKPGRTGNKVAERLAKVLHDSDRAIAAELNDAGAAIREHAGYGMAQSWSGPKIREVGKVNGVLDKSQSFKVWSQDMLANLDHAATFQGEPPLAFLKSVHDNLYTEDHSSAQYSPEEFMLHSGIAGKVAAERKLVFKDADSQLAMLHKYGEKGLSGTILARISTQSKALGLLQLWGPNPKEAIEWVRKQAIEKAKELNVDSEKQVQDLNGWKLSAAINVALGHLDQATNPTWARIQSTAQQLMVSSSLGGTIITALPTDTVFQTMKITRDGFSAVEGLSGNIMFMMKQGGAFKEHLMQSIGFLDSWGGHNLDRFSTADKTNRALTRFNSALFKFQGLDYWTQNSKLGTAHAYAVGLGSDAGKVLADLNPDRRRVLSDYGISASDWDAMRANVQTVNGIPYLTADMIPDRDLSRKLSVLYSDVADSAIPSPTASDRKYTHLGRPGSLGGTVGGMIMLFKSYPIMIANRILGEEVYAHNATIAQYLKSQSGIVRMASFTAASLIAGYLSMAMRDTLNGKTIRKPTKEDGSIDIATFRDSLQRGGIAGIWGDIGLQEWERGWKDPSSYIAGPLVQKTIDGAGILSSKLLQGKDVTADVYRYTRDNVPGSNFIFARQAWDYLVGWHLLEMAKPGAFDEANRNLQNHYGQEYFMEPRR